MYIGELDPEYKRCEQCYRGVLHVYSYCPYCGTRVGVKSIQLPTLGNAEQKEAGE